jgi:hypothetical protein
MTASKQQHSIAWNIDGKAKVGNGHRHCGAKPVDDSETAESATSALE